MSAVPPPIPTRQPQSPVPPVPPQSQNLEFKANFVDGLISYGGKIIMAVRLSSHLRNSSFMPTNLISAIYTTRYSRFAIFADIRKVC